MATRTKKQLAAGQRRSLGAIRGKLLDMAAEWGDVDQFCMDALTDLADRAKETADNLIEDA